MSALVADLPTVTVNDQADFAAQQRAPIDQLLFIVYALLGLAVVIAVLGIVNTLALSVIERVREIGLLRAVGLSRRQLRTMLRLESVAIALLGAVLGVGLGLVFAVALQRSLIDDGIDVLSIPVVQLVGFVAVAAVVAASPRFLAGWAALGDLGRDTMERYAAYRVGYHRGLDTLRASGWRGSGYVRWAAATNHGFLRSLEGLGKMAALIGETDEAERCSTFLLQLDPTGRPND